MGASRGLPDNFRHVSQTTTPEHIMVKLAPALILSALTLAGCISSSSPPPPAKTTVVVPSGSTAVCSDGTKPPC